MAQRNTLAVAEKHFGIALKPVQEIKDGQDGFKRTLSTLDRDIHENAVQCLLHAAIHRDTSLMRRLLVDTLDAVNGKNGYRVKGLVLWVRHFSPMELNKDVIKLSGTDKDGNERPFRVAEAAAMPFWLLTNEVAVIKPLYRDSLMSRLTGAATAFQNALANTGADGLPIDPEKPFYKGIYKKEAQAFFDDIAAQTASFLEKFPDNTAEIDKAKIALEKALGGGAKVKINPEEMIKTE